MSPFSLMFIYKADSMPFFVAFVLFSSFFLILFSNITYFFV
ncbi:hypothetical protein CLOM621_05222 [Clostridium sp. M62/1]|nr:hypothetical protein CLOM621_05222 [Clostridium sp. M62/1]